MFYLELKPIFLSHLKVTNLQGHQQINHGMIFLSNHNSSMLFCCYSDTNSTASDPPEVSQDTDESPSTLLNTPQPPGKKTES